jgi:Mor family transcriptional regulator
MDDKVLREVASRHSQEILEPFDDIYTNAGGFEALRTFLGYYGGCTVYIPTLETVLKRCRELSAKEEYNGDNHGELARKYGFTERQLRKSLYSPKAK